MNLFSVLLGLTLTLNLKIFGGNFTQDSYIRKNSIQYGNSDHQVELALERMEGHRIYPEFDFHHNGASFSIPPIFNSLSPSSRESLVRLFPGLFFTNLEEDMLPSLSSSVVENENEMGSGILIESEGEGESEGEYMNMDMGMEMGMGGFHGVSIYAYMDDVDVDYFENEQYVENVESEGLQFQEPEFPPLDLHVNNSISDSDSDSDSQL